MLSEERPEFGIQGVLRASKKAFRKAATYQRVWCVRIISWRVSERSSPHLLEPSFTSCILVTIWFPTRFQWFPTCVMVKRKVGSKKHTQTNIHTQKTLLTTCVGLCFKPTIFLESISMTNGSDSQLRSHTSNNDVWFIQLIYSFS